MSLLRPLSVNGPFTLKGLILLLGSITRGAMRTKNTKKFSSFVLLFVLFSTAVIFPFPAWLLRALFCHFLRM